MVICRCLFVVYCSSYCLCNPFFVVMRSFRWGGDGRLLCFCCLFDVTTCECYCSLSIPHSAVGWSAVCYCGISSHTCLLFQLFFFCFLTGTVTLIITLYMKELNKPCILIPVSSKSVEERESCGRLNICNWTVMEAAKL